MKLTSPAFTYQAMIPQKYTCQGKDISPPLTLSNIPEGTISLALITDDPDAPMGTWNHWLIWNIKPTEEIKEDSAPGTQGQNKLIHIKFAYLLARGKPYNFLPVSLSPCLPVSLN